MTDEMKMGFVICNYVKIRGLTQRQFAERMGFSDTTLLNRMKRPGGWRLWEMLRAYDVLDIPEEERWL